MKRFFRNLAMLMVFVITFCSIPQPAFATEIPDTVPWVWLSDANEMLLRNVLAQYKSYFNVTYNLSGEFNNDMFRFSHNVIDDTYYYVWSTSDSMRDICQAEATLDDMLQYFTERIEEVDGKPEPTATPGPIVTPIPTATPEPTETPEPTPEPTPTPPQEYTKEELSSLYTDLFSSPASQYFITAQATSAVRLSDNVVLSVDMLSPNYERGVIDLPRLAMQYYYTVEGNDSFSLGKTVYPTLCWSVAAKGGSVTLNICSEDTDAVLWSCKITNPGLDGVNSIIDCSANLVKGLVDESTSVRHYDGVVQLYDAKLHRDSIVMPSYAYTPNKDNYSLDMEYSLTSVESASSVYSRRRMLATGVTTVTDIKDYVGGLESGDLRPGLLFAGSKTQGATFDGNTGTAITVTNSMDVNPLYSFIALNSGCYFSKVDTVTISDSEVNSALKDMRPVEWKAGDPYAFDMSAIGPANFDEWFSSVADMYKIARGEGNYSFLHNSTSNVEALNVYAESLMYAGVYPHFASLSLKHAPVSMKINYYVLYPDKLDWELVDSKEYDPETFAIADMSNPPEVTDYLSTGWYTSQECTTLFKDSLKLDTEHNSEYTVYAKYDYNGGEYTVNFYNSQSGVSDIQKFPCNEKPILPANPEPTAGYAFANWRIVTAQSDKEGTVYDPNSFVPTANTTYIFKTFWDVKGVIDQCLVQRDYAKLPVGTIIDPSKIRVTVFVDNEGTIVQATPDQYILDRNVIDKVGANQFYITYLPTGATALCEITGYENDIVGITAAYTGGSAAIGTQLQASDFHVVATYRNGATQDITGFTFSPSVITNAGQNVITVSYTNFTATVTVQGISGSGDLPTADLQSITASYAGSDVYTGVTLNAADFRVVATYADGTQASVPSTAFQFSPNLFNVPGIQRVVVTYGGKTATCEIIVRQNPNVQATPTPSPTPTLTPTNPPRNTPGPSNVTQTARPTQTTQPPTATLPPANRPSASPSPSPSPSPTGSNGGSNGGVSIVDDRPGSSANGNKDKENTTSTGYLRGANILTNVMGSSSTGNQVVSPVNILDELNKVDTNATQVNLTLVNGAETNTLSKAMLDVLKERKLTAYVDIVSPINSSTVLGRWVIDGASLDHTDTTILDLNITYEVIEKGAETQVLVTLKQMNYPQGIKLIAYPAAEVYSSGTLIRLYSCTVTREFSKLQRTFPWQSSANAIELDPYKYWYYCLSDALDAYPDGSDLKVETEVPVTPVEVPDDSNVGDEGDSDSDWNWDDVDDPGNDEWTWDDPVPEPASSPLPGFLIPVLIGVGVLLLIIVVVVIITSKKKRS